MNDDQITRTRRRRNHDGAPITLDTVGIAMHAERHDPNPDSPARVLLLKQARLLDRQAASETVSLVLKVLTGIVGVVFAAGLGSMMWSASNERGLVIESFSVPPDFAERGITGQVVASRLLDRLSEMAEQTVSVRAPSTYANNWNGDIKVQIPQTGVSVGELQRYLVAWLGKQTTIGGELYRTLDGLTLSARTGTAAAATQTGKTEADLDQMIQQAAEAVYATTQPYRYAIYLGRTQRLEGLQQSKQALLRLTRTGDEADRMWAYAALNLRLQGEGDFAGAIRAADAAIAIAPEFNLAYANRAGARDSLGHAEAAYRDSRLAERTAVSDGARFMREEGLEFVTHSWRAGAASAVGDYQTAADGFRKALAVRPEDASTLARLTSAQLGQHDVAAAFETFAGVPKPPADSDVRDLVAYAAGMTTLAAALALERENWPLAHRLVMSVDETLLLAGERIGRRNNSYPTAALALARAGEVVRAEGLIGKTPTDCYECVWVRGAIVALAGDVAASDRWFAAAVKQGPSLPFAELQWGRAKLARGDVDGAITLFRSANRKGPRWADPLKFWGDALVRKGDRTAALGKYAKAAELAPRWNALRGPGTGGKSANTVQ